ncbi:putative ribonuclease H-like domain-containing protein [Tanacetum coccineum]
MPYDLPLLGGYILGNFEGSKKLNELIDLCTKLLDRVTSLENDLKQTKKVYGNAITKLVKKVKHLEDKLKSTTERRKARMVLSDDEEDLYVTPTKAKAPQVEEQSQEIFEAQLSVLSAAKILADASKERVKTYNRRRRSTDSLRDSTAGGTAGGLFSIAEEIQGKTQIVQERQSGSVIRYHTLKKKPVTVAQARKNMMTYLKNMDGYKMGNFKGMSYDEIRPIFEKEYNKVQTLFKKDTEVGKTEKKIVAEETLLQESFKKLRTAEASSSEPIQEQPTGEPK